ncbi:metallophosphoesterase [uncultured Sphaerotilus sp.]|uniref:metallophosphoesterase n=1 Tax=uncultured Sphaerotilus sp. TaxID=474984 RepID=UPI0030CA3D23
MRLQIFSDLHLERIPHWEPTPAPGADVLVLAGDIGSYQTGSLLTEDDFGLTRFSPTHGAGHWRHVLFVPGNHEYDGYELSEAGERMQALCARLGITWLDRRRVVLDGVRFLGTTLWSDFDSIGPREKAYRAANFYLRKNTCLRGGEPMLAESMRELGLECQEWLRAALVEPFDGPTVVVTHFAPTLASADPRYGLAPGTAGFCNALDDLVARADLWIHGHLHCPVDHVVRGCRVVANPLGYSVKGEQDSFRPATTLTVPRRFTASSTAAPMPAG